MTEFPNKQSHSQMKIEILPTLTTKQNQRRCKMNHQTTTISSLEIKPQLTSIFIVFIEREMRREPWF